MGIVTPCDSIFRITLGVSQASLLASDITVKARLSANTPYWYILTDKFGKIYTSDADGSILMDMSNFPSGLFNPYAGSFLVQVKSTLEYGTAVPLTFCGKSYDTLQIDIADTNSDVPTAIVDCI
jgi:hypothetical protein